MTPTWHLLPLLLASGLALAGVATAAGDAPEQAPHRDPAIAGAWVLDPERSDSVDRAIRRVRRSLERSLRPPQGARATGTDRTQEVVGQLLEPIDPPARRVAIELTGSEVIIRFDDHPPRRLHTDGRPAVVDSDRPHLTTAAWEDGRLYIEQASNQGTRVIESWGLDAGRLVGDFEARNSLFRDPIRFTLEFVPAGETW